MQTVSLMVGTLVAILDDFAFELKQRGGANLFITRLRVKIHLSQSLFPNAGNHQEKIINSDFFP